MRWIIRTANFVREIARGHNPHKFRASPQTSFKQGILSFKKVYNKVTAPTLTYSRWVFKFHKRPLIFLTCLFILVIGLDVYQHIKKLELERNLTKNSYIQASQELHRLELDNKSTKTQLDEAKATVEALQKELEAKKEQNKLLAVAKSSVRPATVYKNYSGNSYVYHSCTWHVKSMRPDIPNDWHNATDWLYNARADGYATGSTPRAGAIGWVYGHVVYIQAVQGNQVYLSERNYDYQGSYRERWADASNYTYIY